METQRRPFTTYHNPMAEENWSVLQARLSITFPEVEAWTPDEAINQVLNTMNAAVNPADEEDLWFHLNLRWMYTALLDNAPYSWRTETWRDGDPDTRVEEHRFVIRDEVTEYVGAMSTSWSAVDPIDNVRPRAVNSFNLGLVLKRFKFGQQIELVDTDGRCVKITRIREDQD